MVGRVKDERYTQRWEEIERQFPGSSAAFDRDLGDTWLEGRDGPRFDIYGPTLHVFVGESVEMDHHGPWASAYFDAEEERWVVKADHRAGAARRWSIAWRDDDDGTGELDLDAGRTYLIGRMLDADIRTKDRMVTRHHARLAYLDGAWTVTDLGSSNGTFCNGTRVESTALRTGDRIQCGDLVIRIQGR